MSIQMPQMPELPELGGKIREEALELIRKEHWDKTHCSLTGVVIGTIADAEIMRCLRIEQDRSPFASADDLSEKFGLQHWAQSSRPAPCFRLHHDHSTLVRVMKSDAIGPKMLFAYLAGKLLFDSLVPIREIQTSTNSMAKLAFLIEFQVGLNNLPDNWFKILTASDEDGVTADRAIRILKVVSNEAPTQIEEAKAAQRGFECLLRLDAIHNLRSAVYEAELKEAFLTLRRKAEWSFVAFHSLLAKLESDSIIRIRKMKNKPEGNAATITAALHSIAMANSSRMGTRDMDAYINKFEKAESAGKFATGTSGNAMMALIHEALEGRGQRKSTQAETHHMESLLKSLNQSMEVSWSDKRVESLKHVMGLKANHGGNTKVRRGDSATKELYNKYLTSGNAVPEVLRTRMAEIEKMEAKARESKGQKAVKKPRKLSLNMQMLERFTSGGGVAMPELKIPGEE